MNKKILKPKQHEPSHIIVKVGEWVRETGKPTRQSIIRASLPAPRLRGSGR